MGINTQAIEGYTYEEIATSIAKGYNDLREGVESVISIEPLTTKNLVNMTTSDIILSNLRSKSELNLGDYDYTILSKPTGITFEEMANHYCYLLHIESFEKIDLVGMYKKDSNVEELFLGSINPSLGVDTIFEKSKETGILQELFIDNKETTLFILKVVNTELEETSILDKIIEDEQTRITMELLK